MHNLQAPNNMASTQKRKRDDAALVQQNLPTPSAMDSQSATPLQRTGDDQSLALEQVLKKVAAGKGEEGGMQWQKLSALCMRYIKVLEEKREIEERVATMKMSGMQAALERKMAEELEIRDKGILVLQRLMGEQFENHEKEVLVLKSDLEARNQRMLELQRERDTLKSKIARLETEHQEEVEQVASADSDADSISDSISDSAVNSDSEIDSVRLQLLQKARDGYEKAVEMLSQYLFRRLQERIGKRGYTNEFLDLFLDGFGIAESARAAIRAGYSSNKMLVWRHWISSVMFDGFEDSFFGMENGQETSDDTTRFLCFLDKKNVDLFPRWLVELFAQSADVHRYELGRFKGDDNLHSRFCDAAREVWDLHKLASSYRPPASLLRAYPGTVYQKPLHVWVKSWYRQPDDNRTRVVACMLTPGFRVGGQVLEAQVLFS